MWEKRANSIVVTLEKVRKQHAESVWLISGTTASITHRKLWAIVY